MKLFLTKLVSAIWVSTFGMTTCAHAQDANTVFLPEETGPIGYQSGQESRDLYQQSKEEALKSGECRPAELDPEGHWGDPACGYQMSIRSNTNAFIAGTNMTVAVILRNTTTNELLRATDYDDSETVLYVQDESGLIKSSPQLPGSHLSFVNIAPKRQIKFKYDLNRQFHLAPGVYKVHAKQFTMTPTETDGRLKYCGDVLSETMTIKVIPP